MALPFHSSKFWIGSHECTFLYSLPNPASAGATSIWVGCSGHSPVHTWSILRQRSRNDFWSSYAVSPVCCLTGKANHGVEFYRLYSFNIPGLGLSELQLLHQPLLVKPRNNPQPCAVIWSPAGTPVPSVFIITRARDISVSKGRTEVEKIGQDQRRSARTWPCEGDS